MTYRIKVIICLVLILFIILLTRILMFPYYNFVKIIASNEISVNKGYGIVYKKNKKTYIVTNHHIISGADNIVVQYGFKEKKARVVNSDQYEDIAILSVPNDRHLLVGSIQTQNHLNDRVWTFNKSNRKIGYITSKNNKVLVKLSDGNYLINAIQMKMNIKKGESGKPLYRGSDIIGMISMTNKKHKHIAYAMDMSQILKIANKLEKGSIKRPDLNIELASTNNKKVLEKYNLNNYGISGVIVTDNYNSKHFKRGDIIVSINNDKIKDIAHFKYYLFNNSRYNFLIYRNKKYIKKTITD